MFFERSPLTSIFSWILAVRFKTLTASLVPIALATALVAKEGLLFNFEISVLALLSCLFIQIGTNLMNDALDFHKGADTEERLGPQRVTQSGLLSPRQVMAGGVVCFILAAILGIPLVLKGGWVIVVIGVLSLICGYIYTGGPYPLAYRGLGDIFVILFFGLVAVGGLYYLHTMTYSWSAVVMGLQVGFLSTVLIAINNLRDVEQDRKADKRTLAVRFGRSFVQAEVTLLLLGTYVLQIFWWFQGYHWATALPILSLVLVWPLWRGIMTVKPGSIYNQFLARAAGVQVIFGLLFCIGMLVN